MRIAIPIWQEKVSPLLDTSSRLLIVVTRGEGELSRFETYLDEVDISRRCQRIQGLKIDVLICGALSRPFVMMLKAAGIDIISGITGRVEDVLQAFFHKKLSHSNYVMPGYENDSSDPKDMSLPACRQQNKHIS